MFSKYTSISLFFVIDMFLFSTFESAIGIDTVVSDFGSNVKQVSFESLVELLFIVIVLLNTSATARLLCANVGTRYHFALEHHHE